VSELFLPKIIKIKSANFSLSCDR